MRQPQPQLTVLTDEEWELVRMRVLDPDWDISQRNDVYELLKKMLEQHRSAQRVLASHEGRGRESR